MLRTILMDKVLTAGSVEAMDSHQAKHYSKVLRMDDGEAVHITDGRGHLYLGRFLNSKKSAEVKVDELFREEPPTTELRLEIAMPKNSTMDWIVEKATEIGVTHISPIVSSRTIVRPDKQSLKKYTERWQTISNGALEQSERLWKVKVEEPLFWDDWLCQIKKPTISRFAFFSELRSELDNEKSGDEALGKAFQQILKDKKKPISLILGPEGGFSDQEQTELLKNGCLSLSLGKSVLRVETAAIVVLTLARLGRCVS